MNTSAEPWVLMAEKEGIPIMSLFRQETTRNIAALSDLLLLDVIDMQRVIVNNLEYPRPEQLRTKLRLLLTARSIEETSRYS